MTLEEKQRFIRINQALLAKTPAEKEAAVQVAKIQSVAESIGDARFEEAQIDIRGRKLLDMSTLKDLDGSKRLVSSLQEIYQTRMNVAPEGAQTAWMSPYLKAGLWLVQIETKIAAFRTQDSLAPILESVEEAERLRAQIAGDYSIVSGSQSIDTCNAILSRYRNMTVEGAQLRCPPKASDAWVQTVIAYRQLIAWCGQKKEIIVANKEREERRQERLERLAEMQEARLERESRSSGPGFVMRFLEALFSGASAASPAKEEDVPERLSDADASRLAVLRMELESAQKETQALIGDGGGSRHGRTEEVIEADIRKYT